MRTLPRFVAALSVIAFGVGTAVGAGILAAAPAGATTTYVVDNAADAPATAANCTTPVAGQCTLRDALAAAFGAATDVTITLPSLAAGQFYNVDSANGQLDVNDNTHTVTINGGGQSTTILQATCSTPSCSITTRPLKVETGTTADISGVTVQDGNPSGGNGGGILDCGTMTLTDSTVTGNNAATSGGGIELSSGGSATLNNDTISDNTTTSTSPLSQVDGGAGIFVAGSISTGANLTLNGTTVTQNNSAGDGAGIMIGTAGNTGTVVDINNSTISGNILSGADGFGGGLSQEVLSTLDIAGSTISGNHPIGGVLIYGAGLYLGGLSAPTTLTNDTIADNQGDGSTGIYISGAQTSIAGSTISGNDASSAGAGMYIFGTPTMTTIADTTLSGNITTSNPSGQSFQLGEGGAFVNDGCNPVTFVNDTIANNSADVEGGGYLGTDCGTELPVFRANEASGAAAAGAPSGHVRTPHVTATATAVMQFDTVAGNANGSGGGGGNIQLGTTNYPDDSTLTLAETIVANGIVGASPTTNCAVDTGATLTSLGYNLVDDSTCGTAAATDIIGKNPQLGALANNGGPTQDRAAGQRQPGRRRRPRRGVGGHGGRGRPARGGPRGGGELERHHRGGRGGPELQRLPHGGQRGRHLRLRPALQRLFGQQPPQRPHRRHRQLAGPERLPDGRR